jgi:hypothetical protein
MFAAKDDGNAAEAAELQKAHYKTDWHRYNLKRKVANLPPVTAENFQERVLAQQKEVVISYYVYSVAKFFGSTKPCKIF